MGPRARARYRPWLDRLGFKRVYDGLYVRYLKDRELYVDLHADRVIARGYYFAVVVPTGDTEDLFLVAVTYQSLRPIKRRV